MVRTNAVIDGLANVGVTPAPQPNIVIEVWIADKTTPTCPVASFAIIAEQRFTLRHREAKQGPDQIEWFLNLHQGVSAEYTERSACIFSTASVTRARSENPSVPLV